MNTVFLKILQEEKAQLLQKLNAVEKAIHMYGSADNEIGSSDADNICAGVSQFSGDSEGAFFKKYYGYNVHKTTRDKVLFILQTEKRFLHAREMARIMQLLEGADSVKKVIRKISPALSLLKRMPGSAVMSIEADGLHFNTFWGFKDWITNDGNIGQPFMYNKSEITRHKRQVSY